MKKTKLGVSVALLGAITYCMGLFGGYMALLLLAGYILLCEENDWLKFTAVKAVVVAVAFTVISELIQLIPSVLGVISNLLAVINVEFYPKFIYNIVNAASGVIILVKNLLLLLLGFKALSQGTIAIGKIDKILEKHFLNKD